MSNELMQKMAEVAPQHYEFLLKTAEEVKTSPFKDEILNELSGLMKTAIDWKGVGGAALRGAGAIGGAVGAAAAGGIAMALAGDMYEATKRGLTKTRNYKQMMSANPALRDLPAKDVQKAFSVLHRFNPEFSGDPTVAGAWVKRQATYGEDSFGDVNQLKGLIDSRKSLADTKRLPQVPDVKGLRMGGGGKDKEKNGPGGNGGGPGGPGGHDPAMNQKLEAILQQLHGQDADAADMFNNQQRFFQAPGGGQRTIPNK